MQTLCGDDGDDHKMSCGDDHKMFQNSLFYGTPPVAAFENGWRISKNF